MFFVFIEDLQEYLSSEFGVEDVNVVADLCPAEFSGDITINCFLLARQLKRNPMQIASACKAFLETHADVTAAEQVKAFVNVTINPGSLFRDTVAKADKLLQDVCLPTVKQQKIVFEYSAPNTNKPQHLGHVRNNTIGMATVALLRRVGHEVIPINLINDRGIHICKSMLAYQRWGDGRTPASVAQKGDHFVGYYYVKYDLELKRQLQDLRRTHPEWAKCTDEELFLKTEIGRAAQEMLVPWENSDPEVRALWEKMNAWVIAGFNQTYERMGVEFEHTYLESETFTLGKDIVQEGLSKAVFQQRPDKAIVVDLSSEGLGEKVVLRSDGTSVYMTQDLGTTLLKQNDYAPQRQIWVVGDEQKYHFQVLFSILKRLGYAWAENLTHMAYGMVNLPSGKMKSREGTVVDADDLFDIMDELARTATRARYAEEPEDLEKRARTIGMGALKFMLLKVNPKTSLLFDPEASIKFEGDTGPYVLYAYARISSMLEKVADANSRGKLVWQVLGNAEERDLALRCSQYPAILIRAAEELDLSFLTGYLLDLAKSFSRFYRSCPVLSAPSEDLQHTRLELCRRVRAILHDGLQTLTIDTLENM